MPSIRDDRGYNQGYKPSRSVEVRTARRAERMAGMMGLDRSETVLEIGCGTGRLSYLIAKKTGKKVYGTDICVPFIEEAKKTYSLDGLEYSAVDFSDGEKVSQLSGGGFDYVIGDGILHHLYPVLDRVLSDIYRLLKKGGRFIFFEPNFFNPYCLLIFNIGLFRKLARLEPGEMTFTAGKITGRLQNAGFSGIKTEFKDFLVPGVPDFLIGPSIIAGDILEKLPGLKMLAQSLFMYAEKRGE
jgi:SAM-dependent methyltransferase